MTSKVSYDTGLRRVVPRKGRIAFETEFWQVYNDFLAVAFRINSPMTMKLLFWLLYTEANEHHSIIADKAIYIRFCAELAKTGKSISRSTFDRCISEMWKASATTRVGRGHYYFNPFVFWNGTPENRIELLKKERELNIAQSDRPAPLGDEKTKAKRKQVRNTKKYGKGDLLV